MTCPFQSSFSLSGLETAPGSALRALLAALVLEREPGASPELADPLRAIAAGAATDEALLRRGFAIAFRDVDDTHFYDGGFCEHYGRLQSTIDVLSTGDRATLIAACRSTSAELVANLADSAFWSSAHSSGYYLDSAAVRARVEREAREHVEETWREIRTTRTF